MTPDERAALRALAETAAPGPWECYDERAELEDARPMWVLERVDGLGDWMHDLADLGSEPADRANGDFIAAARDAVLPLLDALDAETARADAAERATRLSDADRRVAQDQAWEAQRMARAAAGQIADLTTERGEGGAS